MSHECDLKKAGMRENQCQHERSLLEEKILPDVVIRRR
jgi:hypothetical protein